MNYSEHLARQHVRQTLRLGGALLLVVLTRLSRLDPLLDTASFESLLAAPQSHS